MYDLGILHWSLANFLLHMSINGERIEMIYVDLLVGADNERHGYALGAISEMDGVELKNSLVVRLVRFPFPPIHTRVLGG